MWYRRKQWACCSLLLPYVLYCDQVLGM